jgi:nitrate reductase gamma subunit
LIYRALADLVLVVHLAFVLFVVLGGLLVHRWQWVALLHIPAAVWGVLIEYSGWICPLTPLENSLRVSGGEAGYSGGFIQHYIQPVLYPAGLTRGTQIVLGTLALVVNLTAYGVVIARRKRLAQQV